MWMEGEDGKAIKANPHNYVNSKLPTKIAFRLFLSLIPQTSHRNNKQHEMQSGDNSRSIFGQSILHYVFVKDKMMKIFNSVQPCDCLTWKSIRRENFYNFIGLKFSLIILIPCGLPATPLETFHEIIDFFPFWLSYRMRTKSFSFPSRSLGTRLCSV